MSKTKILAGKKTSAVSSNLHVFENVSPDQWEVVRRDCQIPEGFMFLAGIVKYPRRHAATKFKYGKDHVFVQSFLPHSDSETYRTRGYGALYATYEPTEQHKDDIVLTEAAIYQALPDNRIRLILANGENRNAASVAAMFEEICRQKDLPDFSPVDSKPGLYTVTFNKKSCGYFLKGRTYIVWAKPIGLPDLQSGEVHKGWLFCDIFCGVPAIMKADREVFEKLPDEEGAKIGIFTIEAGKLVFRND